MKAGEPLDDPEEANLGRVMKAHPHYYHYWDRAASYGGRLVSDHGTNPFLHLQMEVALENQLTSGEVPEVREALDALVARGVDEHQARHMVLEAFVQEFWVVLKKKRPFGRESYWRKLRELARRP